MSSNPSRKKRTRKEIHEDYDGFVEKFKPKKTTDDCMTPPEVYDEVVRWVDERIAPLEGLHVVRPFWPGADYTAVDYGPDDVVVDNPPFSILSRIIDFYLAHGVRFFLFAPALTLFSAPRPGVTYVAAHCEIVYANGAKVRTGFVTNMQGEFRIMVAGDLYERVRSVMDMVLAVERKSKRVMSYPPEVVSSATLGRIAVRGLCLNVPFSECTFIKKLDCCGKTIFGGAYLLSDRAAADRAAADRAAADRAAADRAAAERLLLSDRERELVKSMGKR